MLPRHQRDIPFGKAGNGGHLSLTITAFETEMTGVSAYLNHTHTGVQENGSFGLFGDLLIFVEVQIIRAIPELG